MKLSTFFKKFWFNDNQNTTRLPKIGEATTLNELLAHFPHTLSFIQSRFHVVLDEKDGALSLSEVSKKHHLPPAQILFMEIQLQQRIRKVHQLNAKDAKRLLDRFPNAQLLDVREPWERAHGGLPGARPLNDETAGELRSWPKDTPVLVYCHYGVRSLDAAAYLADLGFTQVHALAGGIDAWSSEIDSSIPRYCGSYC